MSRNLWSVFQLAKELQGELSMHQHMSSITGYHWICCILYAMTGTPCMCGPHSIQGWGKLVSFAQAVHSNARCMMTCSKMLPLLFYDTYYYMIRIYSFTLTVFNTTTKVAIKCKNYIH